MATIFRGPSAPRREVPQVANNLLLSWSDSGRLDNLLAHQDTFFSGPGSGPDYDWPNPRGKPYPYGLYSFTNSLSLELLHQDQFFSGAGSGPDYDWPNPRGPQYPVELRTFRSPVRIELNASALPLVQTLAPPNPNGPAFPLEDRGFIGQTPTKLIGQDTFFGGSGAGPSYDYPNPSLGKPYPIELRTWARSVALNLLGQDAFFCGPGSGPDYDYPNPRGPQYPASLRIWTQSPSLLFGTDQFFSAPGLPPTYDYPNPRGPQHAIQLRTWGQSPSLLFGADQFFAAPGQPPKYDYPNPTLRQSSVPSLSAWQPNNNLTLSTIIVLPATMVFDYPNPRGPAFASDLRTWLAALPQNLLGKDQFFGPAGQGAVNTDWPNPRGRAFPQDLRTWLTPSAVNLAGQDQLFGAVGQPLIYDWPNPGLGKPYPVALRTWSQSPSLFGLDRFFGAAGQPPAYDWPNPVLRQSHLSALAAWQPNNSLVLVPIVVLPAAMTFDWPNPRGPAYAQSLRTWANPLVLNLLGQDQFFGAAGQAPRYDWPMPVRPNAAQQWQPPVNTPVLAVFTATGPVYVAFTWNAPIAPTQRLTEAIFIVTTSNASSVLAAMNSSWPAVRCQTTANDFFGNGVSGGGLGQQHSALTQDNSGTFGPFYDGTVLIGPATTFFTSLKNAGLSASAPLLVWLDSESQNFYATYTAAQLNSIAADTRAVPLIAAVGTSNLAALTTSQQEAFDSWVAGQYDAALTLLANAIKAVFPNAFVCNFNSVQISQALQQVDGGGTPYYRSNPPAGGVSSPEVYDDLSQNVLIYNYQINGASVNWRDPFFNLVYLLNRSRACRASNPTNGFIAEIANYTDTDLGVGALVPLSLTPYWGELVRHQSLMSTFGGSLLDFNPFHHTQDSTCDAVMLDVLTAAHGKPPQTLWTTAQIGYTPTDGVYTYVTLSDGTTLGRYTFAGATQSVMITTPDNKNFTLNRPFGQVGMWFGTALGTPFSVPPPGGFLLFDLSTPGKPLQVAYAI